VIRWLAVGVFAWMAVIGGGCQPYDRPQRPLPQDFEVRRLGGGLLGAEALRGRPWVLHLWAPG
jgi:hypothetical protein